MKSWESDEQIDVFKGIAMSNLSYYLYESELDEECWPGRKGYLQLAVSHDHLGHMNTMIHSQ